MADFSKDTREESKEQTPVFFIHHSAVPKGCIPTYAKFVCAYKPHKADPYRVRMTVGGDRVEYPSEVETKTADLTVTKAILNSV
jgi:hypothetical protein